MQQSIEFILQQQAKAALDTMQLSAFGAELAKNQVRMYNALGELGDSHKQIVESHRQLAESHRQLAEAQRQLAEAQKRTEEKLSAFISALDRRFGGDGKGRE